jgi:hypothetical protein
VIGVLGAGVQYLRDPIVWHYFGLIPFPDCVHF